MIAALTVLLTLFSNRSTTALTCAKLKLRADMASERVRAIGVWGFNCEVGDKMHQTKKMAGVWGRVDLQSWIRH